MQNLKKAIMAQKLWEDKKRKAERKNLKGLELSKAIGKGLEASTGGFLAFWRSVDAAETIKKVTFYHYVTLSFPLIELPGIFTYAAIIS